MVRALALSTVLVHPEICEIFHIIVTFFILIQQEKKKKKKSISVMNSYQWLNIFKEIFGLCHAKQTNKKD